MKNAIITGKNYYGLDWKYNEHTHVLEFTKGNLTWNNNGDEAIPPFIGFSINNMKTAKITKPNRRYVYMAYKDDCSPKGINTINIRVIKFDDDVYTKGLTNMAGMFSRAYNLRCIKTGKNFDTSHVISMDNVFNNAALVNIKSLKNWNTSKVISTIGMFMNNCTLRDINPLSNWDMHSMFHIDDMFKNCNLSNLNALKNWNTSKIFTMDGTFSNNPNLVDISGLSHWNTQFLSYLDGTFANDEELKNLNPLIKWNTRRLSYVNNLFDNINPDANMTALSYLPNNPIGHALMIRR